MLKHKKGLFITGTNTEIGKTVVSCLLVSALNSWIKKTSFLQANYFKPVQTGTVLENETEVVASLLNRNDIPPPAYSFPEPVAPAYAASLNGAEICIDVIVDRWSALDEGAWVVEGAGGLLVPLNSRLTTRDLIQALNMEIIVAASTRLGTINHSLLTVEAAQRVGISVAGVVLVGDRVPEIEPYIAGFSGVPILCHIPLFSNITPTVIREEGPRCFNDSLLERLYGKIS